MNLDFAQARNLAFDYLSLTDSISVLSTAETKELELGEYFEVWRVKTEIFLPDNSVSDIQLHICLPFEFPLVIPRIYLSSDDNKRFQFIPHVNIKGYICTFDEESITPNMDEPGKMAKEVLNRAIQIIEDGLAKKNNSDFLDEFVAYWEDVYDENDEVAVGINILDREFEPIQTTIPLLQLSSSYNGYNVILHNDSVELLQLKSYLKERHYSFLEAEALYIGEINTLLPPFTLTNEILFQVIQSINYDLVPHLQKYLNQKNSLRILIFSIVQNQERIFFGWRIKRLEVNRKGFRRGILSAMDVFASFQKHDYVQRIKFEKFTKARLQSRTEGNAELKTPFRIAVAGVGSIGSNLLRYLLPLEIGECLLIDNDILTMENTPRHLLGMNSIGLYKVDALKRHLEDDNPLLKVNVIRRSLIPVIADNVKKLNSYDYIFVAIGKDNIERYVIETLKSGGLEKPVFLLWVEPYLIGAHCLLIQPNHNISFHELYSKNLFHSNIISEEEYLNPDRKFKFKEAGCQASYLPYGMKNILLYLSGIIPHIYRAMENKSQQNLHIAWRGNEKIRITENIALSEIGKRMGEDTVQINQL